MLLDIFYIKVLYRLIIEYTQKHSFLTFRFSKSAFSRRHHLVLYLGVMAGGASAACCVAVC